MSALVRHEKSEEIAKEDISQKVCMDTYYVNVSAIDVQCTFEVISLHTVHLVES